uniref:Putative RNase III protein n=1 Tax=Erythrocytic necrosis virus TaxID=1543320 RepID=A0A4D6QNA5_9VIRU|nr:putative RNase III protein [Erythrocytic necrosis virus]
MAFTSHRENHQENYQILEFLGDSVIFSVITWYLYRRFPQFQESKSLGIITRLKGTLISKKSLAHAAQELGFEKFLNLNITSDFNKDAFLEDVFEAFIGAVNLAFDDYYGTMGAGYSVCYKILKGIFDKRDISVTYDSIIDPKSILKELIDAHPELGVLEYVQDFTPEPLSRLFLNDVEIGVGIGKNKKIQQPIAAKQGLDYIKHTYGIIPSGNKFAQKYTRI